MSTNGARDFRPELHFTPKTGWINDPNGLVYVNGVYHLFAQHFPDAPHWGPMHWYHATSRDLVRWEHLPIALAPDELGLIFSGSAVYDAKNSSGLGSAENPPIVAMFTHHGRSEQQSIAWSTDCIRFEKFAGNPVIPNTELRDFRDPKVFANPVRGGWSVALAAGDRVKFFASDDLKSWRETGEFGPEGNFSAGVWECPDIFPLETPKGTRWVLLVSMNPTERGSRTQYFIGDFDGDRFVLTEPFDRAEYIDCGTDSYAGVTWFGAPERTFVTWAGNWTYANDLPTGEFCCQMGLPRTLELVDTPLGGLRLAQRFVALPFGDAKPCDGGLPGEVFRLTARGSGPATIRLSNGDEWLEYGVDEKGEIFVDRTHAGAKDFNEKFAEELYCRTSAPRLFKGAWELDLIFDRSITELQCDGGTRAFTTLVYPTRPYDRVVATDGTELSISTL